MKKILFVCLGNICRSPIAEGIARHIIHIEGLNIYVDSAGISHRYEGEHPCKYSVQIANEKGIDISTLRSRPICNEDIKKFDYVICMDEKNKQYLINFGFKHVYKLGDFGGLKGKDVPDPYFFQSFEGVDQVFEMIDLCTKDLLKQKALK